MKLETATLRPVWHGQAAIIAATGPSLTADVAEACRAAQARGTHRVVAVNDAYKLLPFADVLYACDAAWWDVHKGCPEFAGEKWSTHGSENHNDKSDAAAKWKLSIVAGTSGRAFSTNPSQVVYGMNSGFQAINLALLFGANPLVLVGFNLGVPIGRPRHFFGRHPRPLQNSVAYSSFIPCFEAAAKALPAGVRIINATPDSALRCFPMRELGEALEEL